LPRPSTTSLLTLRQGVDAPHKTGHDEVQPIIPAPLRETV
jgi:hypothetical protein